MIDGIETQPCHLLYLPASRQVSLNLGLCYLACLSLHADRCWLTQGCPALYDIPVPRIESGAGLAHSVALRLPPDELSRDRPCLRLVFMVLSSRQYQGSHTGDLHPIRSRPCRAYTNRWRSTGKRWRVSRVSAPAFPNRFALDGNEYYA
jgi:hypothetical protein